MGELTVKDLTGYLWTGGLPVLLLASFAYSIYKGWFVTGREYAASEARCAAAGAVAAKWEAIALRLLSRNESLTDTVEAVAKK